MVNALPYLLLVLAYGLLYFYHQYTQSSIHRTYINIVCVLIFVFFFGFRGFINYDWVNYYPFFNSLTSDPLRNIETIQMEPGFVLLASVSKLVYPSYQLFVFVCTIINITLLTLFFNKYTEKTPLAFLIFLCMNGFQMSTDLMRNSISILIIINTFNYIQERRPIPYMFWCLFAASFHSSSLFFIPLYFVLNRSYNRWVLIGIFVAANIVYILHIPIFREIVSLFIGLVSPTTAQWIDTYLNFDATTGSVLSIGYIERLITGVLMFCYLGKLRNIRKDNDIFINSLFLFLCLFLFLSEFRTISMRVSTLFSYSYWIIWIDLLDCFRYRNNRFLFILFIVTYCLLKTYSNNKNKLSDYYNVLFEEKNYTERLLHFRQYYYDGAEK